MHREEGWGTPSPHRPSSTGGRPAAALSPELLVGLAHRLQARADRQSAVLDRLRDAERSAQVLADLAALAETVRRTRRDAENLLLVAGAAESPPARPTTVLADVIQEAAGGVELSARVMVAPVPAATVPSWAVSDLVLVLTEVFDHAAQIAPPGGRIDVVSRRCATGEVVVEAIVDGPGIPSDQLDVLNRLLAGQPAPAGPHPLGLLAAAEVALRAGIEVRLQPRLHGPDLNGPGLISTVRCPNDMVRAELEPHEPRAVPPRQRDSEPIRHDHTYSSAAVGSWTSPEPEAGSALRVTADDLFGPPLPIADDEDLSATPIFQAVASAWFRDRHRDDSDDWETPSDAEWRAAAERANRTEGLDYTPSGLPRRRPGSQMVAPPRRGAGPAPSPGPVARAPERVRYQLSSYQRGLQQGRHRAADPSGDRDEDLPSWWRDNEG